jgi:hypothetical protein
LINVAIAEKLAQIRTAKWFADRIAAANPKAGAQLIRDLSRGGSEKPRKGDVIARAAKRRSLFTHAARDHCRIEFSRRPRSAYVEMLATRESGEM